MTPPRVLMVTGVYHPETSGAALQCRQLVRSLADRVRFRILTTTSEPSLPATDIVEGVPLDRVFVDPGRLTSKAAAAAHMTQIFLRLRDDLDIVHLHGFSQKTMLLVALARQFAKQVVIKLTSVGHDDPLTMRARGGAAFAAYRRADRFIGVSPRFETAYAAAGLPDGRYRFIPNAVDTDRFRPAAAGEAAALRAALGLAPDRPVVLFVGFFSPEKRPDVLYRAWAALQAEGLDASLVLVGRTRSAYYEIDPAMAEAIKRDAAARRLADRVYWVEHTDAIERYYRAADVFALPTTREGLPNVLLEAMASGVAPIITALPGVTDWIVAHQRTGLLVGEDDAGLEAALRTLLTDVAARTAMGQAARRDVEQRFAPAVTAARTADLYGELLAATGRH